MNYLDQLNEEQKKAVLYTEGPLMIVAGAGTGKTKTLTYRIFHLIKSGVDPRSILGITFTNKAAGEMRARMRALHDVFDHEPVLKTFHAFGTMVLRENANVLGYPKHFSILDPSDGVKIIKDLLEADGLDPKEHDPKIILNMISRAKNDGVSPHEFAEGSRHPLAEIIADIWQKYESAKRREHGFDFDDLLLVPRELLAHHEEIRTGYQKRFRYIHIDEYQDTNTVQYDLARMLAGEEKNICVVGDTDQNIYSWRGANIKNMLNFEKDFPGAVCIMLEKNYRSTDTILAAADAVIEKNTARFDKKLLGTQGPGTQIKLVTCMNETDEAYHIAQSAQDMIRSGVKPGEIAVLFRTNFQSRVLEEAFLGTDVPYQMLGTKFFERKEVRDAISYIRAAVNRESFSDIKRAITNPSRGIGKVALAKILAGDIGTLAPAAARAYGEFTRILDSIANHVQDHPLSESVSHALECSGLLSALRKNPSSDEAERVENLKELVSFASKYDDLPHDEGLLEFLENAALMSDQDNLSSAEAGDRVRLMTIHASKGLEFDSVFVAGLEQGLFPHTDEGSSADEREEERRLCYVAFTRARKELVLSWAYARKIFGQLRWNEPSEFMADIPQNLVEQKGDSPSHNEEKTVYLDF